ncbi:c-type cytochrome [Roseobacter sp.]|uniref:c-type cytochrome n=1 Tax=Roseobacter sp. TaxID=1907202 RepID=UPI002606F094|nr:cytochrome c [Roseobacter sp.]MDW3183641.1 cytochrome c [Roseobacter sp.]
MSIRLWWIGLLASVAVTGCGEGRDRSASGAALFAQNCAVCHGQDARGGGGGGVEGLSKTPPDLTGLAARNGGSFPANDVLAVLEGYAVDGQRGRHMAGFAALQSEDRKRARLDGARIRTTPPLADLLVYLEAVQRP